MSEALWGHSPGDEGDMLFKPDVSVDEIRVTTALQKPIDKYLDHALSSSWHIHTSKWNPVEIEMYLVYPPLHLVVLGPPSTPYLTVKLIMYIGSSLHPDECNKMDSYFSDLAQFEVGKRYEKRYIYNISVASFCRKRPNWYFLQTEEIEMFSI